MNIQRVALPIIITLLFTVVIIVAAGCSPSVPSGSSSKTSTQTTKAEVEDKFVGTWIGYDTYTLRTVNSPEKLTDLGISMTLEVKKDGSGSLDENFTNTDTLSNLTFKKAVSGNGYQVFDGNDEGVGALEWGAKNGDTEWVVLFVPGDEDVCFSFYKSGSNPESKNSSGTGLQEEPAKDERLNGKWYLDRVFTPGNIEAAWVPNNSMELSFDETRPTATVIWDSGEETDYTWEVNMDFETGAGYMYQRYGKFVPDQFQIEGSCEWGPDGSIILTFPNDSGELLSYLYIRYE